MELAPDLGAIGFIFHPGIHGGVGYQAALPRAEEVIEVVLDTASEGAVLAMEYMDGSGQHICMRFDELGGILEEVDCLGLKIMLDNQYFFDVSYDLTNRIALQQVVDELGAVPDAVYVLAVNANIR